MLRTFWTVGVIAARPAAAMLFLVTFAGAWLSTIPLLILFVFAGKHLMSGIMAGAVKG